MNKISSLIFSLRGYLMAPYGILLLLFGKPTWASFLWGLFFVLLGEWLRFWGVGYAGKCTRKSNLDAPKLITRGPYAYLRHPLYAGNALTGFGGWIMAIGNASLSLASGLFTAFLFFYGTVYGILIPLEENFLRQQFGESYLDYEQSVNRLLPKLKPYSKTSGNFSFQTALASEIHTLIPLFILILIMGLKIK
jgi:protein-S-isoprenylcysteine O-methyltransferase Ste14